MKFLVIVAHGSRRIESNNEVRIIASRLSEMSIPSYSEVRYGFLELAEPSIPDAIIACIECGATEVTVMPYFLSAGRHVTKDIPAELAKVHNSHPHCPLRLTPYLGAAPGILQLISNIVVTSDSETTQV